jgi:NAD(P)-dependent dehydrogenase (short-subunit alcohol dehydrogenase family)
MKRNGEACHNPDHEPHKTAVTERPVVNANGPRFPLWRGGRFFGLGAMNPIPALFSLQGKVALVTGGARNLGYDIASSLAAAGADIIVTSRQHAAAAAAAGNLARDYKVDTLGVALDQRTHESIATAIAAAHAWKERIDILVNNAGGGSGQSAGHIFERSPADVEELVQTNLVGVLHCCQAVGRLMAARRSGKIINIASIAGLVGRDRRMYERHQMKGQPVDYAAAKAGVLGLTRDLAGVLSPFGVHVNAISPGGFARENLPPGFIRDYSDRTPLGRMGRAGVDLKGAALFLAAPASDYITGQNLVVDGGFSIWH